MSVGLTFLYIGTCINSLLYLIHDPLSPFFRIAIFTKWEISWMASPVEAFPVNARDSYSLANMISTYFSTNVWRNALSEATTLKLAKSSIIVKPKDFPISITPSIKS